MRRVLFLQPSVQPPGGTSGVAAWMIHALQADYDLSVLTLEPFVAEPINRFYGTRIDPTRVHALRAEPHLYPWLKRLPLPLALLKSSLLFRWQHKLAGDFEVLITANNEADLHAHGIQYVHYPANLRPRPEVDRRDYHWDWLTAPYYAACDRLAGFTRAGVKQNLTLVNSDWTGRLMSRWYDGLATMTLYPPVAGDFQEVPWSDRANDFLCIGRIAPEKDLDRVFDILTAVRERVPDVRLHLIGTGDHSAYCRHIRRVARERAWVTLHEDVSRAELVRLISAQRYGIHAMAEEHFGMGVAEMVRAGCLVWVPNGGGQVEIVGGDERLVYRSNAEAVDKITAVLTDDALAERVRAALSPQRERFSEERFVEDFLRVVSDFCEAKAAPVPVRAASES